MNFYQSLMGIQGALDTITKSLGNTFADIWCVAIFVLIDLATPYLSNTLFNMGLLQGVGTQIFQNLIFVLKLQVCEDWKGKLKMGS